MCPFGPLHWRGKTVDLYWSVFIFSYLMLFLFPYSTVVDSYSKLSTSSKAL